jgi:hypothetical protein
MRHAHTAANATGGRAWCSSACTHHTPLHRIQYQQRAEEVSRSTQPPLPPMQTSPATGELAGHIPPTHNHKPQACVPMQPLPRPTLAPYLVNASWLSGGVHRLTVS